MRKPAPITTMLQMRPAHCQRVYFLITDGEDGDDGHVEGIEPRPPFDDPIAGGCSPHPRHKDEQGPPQAVSKPDQHLDRYHESSAGAGRRHTPLHVAENAGTIKIHWTIAPPTDGVNPCHSGPKSLPESRGSVATRTCRITQASSSGRRPSAQSTTRSKSRIASPVLRWKVS